MADDVGSMVAKRMRELEVKVAKANWRRVGADLPAVAVKAARSDLGASGGFSGWQRGRVVRLQAKVAVHRDGSGLSVHRDRASAGPWRVADAGRNRGGGGFAGPGVNRSTGLTARTKSGGVRKVRATGRRRWNGVTDGMNTWAEAERLMEPIALRALKREFVTEVVKEFERPM